MGMAMPSTIDLGKTPPQGVRIWPVAFPLDTQPIFRVLSPAPSPPYGIHPGETPPSETVAYIYRDLCSIADVQLSNEYARFVDSGRTCGIVTTHLIHAKLI
jgi:hypothetical protein